MSYVYWVSIRIIFPRRGDEPVEPETNRSPMDHAAVAAPNDRTGEKTSPNKFEDSTSGSRYVKLLPFLFGPERFILKAKSFTNRSYET